MDTQMSDPSLSFAGEPTARRRERHLRFSRATRKRIAAPALLALAAVLGLVAPTAAIASATTAPAISLSWVAESPATSPSPRVAAAMAYDPATQQLVLFGGENNTGGGALGDTWSWNGSTWSELDPSTSPSARSNASMAYDPASGQLLLFGGENSSDQNFGDTWSWNGSTWVDLDPSTNPPARVDAAMAYDPALGELVLFGGSEGTGSGGTYDGDTWAWNGTTWTELNPTGSTPAARAGASMAYDTATSQLVLFGGDGANGLLDDTWTFTGSAWSEASPATSPSVLGYSAMAYDPTSSQLVLFNGLSGEDLGSTWSWTGSNWNESTSPAVNPPFNYGSSMAYDTATSQLLLFGGILSSSTWIDLPEAAPAITSSGMTSFTTGAAGSFTVGTTGNPAPTVSEAGGLPKGVTLSPSGVLSGTPANGTGGAYDFEITASNDVGSPATEAFILIVDQSPVVTSHHAATFVVGTPGKFQGTASAYPPPTFSEADTLPAGLTLSPSGLLAGTPAADTAGTYKIVLKATNAAGSGTQKFTLTVGQSVQNQAPVITSLHSETFVVGSKGKFQVTATGTPAPTFTETGNLPPGVTLSAAGLLSGDPAVGSDGTYPVVLEATNAAGTGTQKFTLTVVG